MDAFFGAGAASRGPRSRARRGRNATVRVDLDLSECAFGATRDLAVDTAVVCPTCSGEGTAPGTHPETCDVCGGRGEVSHVAPVVPRPGDDVAAVPGVRRVRHGHPAAVPGMRRATAGSAPGAPSRSGSPRGSRTGPTSSWPARGRSARAAAPPGDLFLEIVQRPHPIFERQADDLHCTVTIPMTAAALGAALSVETLDGARDLDIRPGTQSGQVIPMYGLGVRHLNSSGRGDLVIHVTVETPTKLDEEQEALLKQLAKLRAEETPPGRFAPGQQGFFSRLRDAFNGR